MKAVGCRADCHVGSVRTGKGNPLAPAMLMGGWQWLPRALCEPHLREKQCCDPLLMSAVAWEEAVMGAVCHFYTRILNLPETLARCGRRAQKEAQIPHA